MKKILNLLSCFSVVFLLGCASARQFVPMPDQTKNVEDPTKGRIYVIRPSAFGGAVGMNIADSGNPIGSSGPGTYLCWEREPGDVIVSSTSENTSRVAIPLRSQSVYYILQHIRMGMWIARTDLELITEEQARIELKRCKPAKFELQEPRVVSK
jgi:hypothetical protein